MSENNEVLCHCMHVTAADIREAFNQGADNFKKLQEKTGCGTCCGTCETDIENFLEKLKTDSK